MIREHGVEVWAGDARSLVADVGPVEAVITDPPYELGTMAVSWEARGVAFDTLFWRRVLNVLRPGGWCAVFGSPRRFGRVQLALEDAGFEYVDTVCWLHGSGFPKRRTNLRPAWEPVLLSRKPAKRVRQLNIDAARFGPGRYPANVVLDDEAAAILDAQSGFSRSSRRMRSFGSSTPPRMFGRLNGRSPGMGGHDDEGGASRFMYVAKPSREEKDQSNLHVSVKPLELMMWLVRLLSFPGDTVLDPFAGSGSTLIAARREGRLTIGIESDERSVQTIRRRLYREAARERRKGVAEDSARVGCGDDPRQPLEPEQDERAGAASDP